MLENQIVIEQDDIDDLMSQSIDFNSDADESLDGQSQNEEELDIATLMRNQNYQASDFNCLDELDELLEYLEAMPIISPNKNMKKRKLPSDHGSPELKDTSGPIDHFTGPACKRICLEEH